MKAKVQLKNSKGKTVEAEIEADGSFLAVKGDGFSTLLGIVEDGTVSLQAWDENTDIEESDPSVEATLKK
jgi:hypothetical protein